MKTLARRRRFVALFASLVLAPVIWAVPAHAAGADPRQIVPNAIALGGSVTGPGFTSPRSISAENAGRFMQSWLGFSIFGHPIKEHPAAGAAVYHLVIHQQFRAGKEDLKVFYAIKGSKHWVGMPPQGLGWAIVPVESWIRAPALTIKTFRDAVGDLPPVSPSGSATRPSSSGDGSSAWVWFVVGGALVVVIAGGLLLRRRSQGAIVSRERASS